MLGLVAAQLKYKVENKEIKAGKAVWVDVSDESNDSKLRKTQELTINIYRSVVALGMQHTRVQTVYFFGILY